MSKTKLRYCLQCKTKWIDGNTWWRTENFSDDFDHLVKDSLPLLKQHNKEVKAIDSMIEGYEYRIILEIVMANDEYLRSVTNV